MMRIAVVGLGQIGGSIVLTLRKTQKKYFITGIDVSARRLKLLNNSLDHASPDWKDATDSDLIIVCLHYELTAKFLKHADQRRLLMDVCSGKAELVQLANRRKLRFIGGHPMAGNEFEGEKGWDDRLFESAPFFLCPAKGSLKQDLQIVRRFTKDLQSRPVVVDPSEHDRFVSITSHFPAVLSGLLSQMANQVPEEFRGPGFRSMTRLANTPSALLNTFLEANGRNIGRAAKEMQKLLARFLTAKAPRTPSKNRLL